MSPEKATSFAPEAILQKNRILQNDYTLDTKRGYILSAAQYKELAMVLILDVNLESGAHVRDNLCYLICLR